jgi:hypothetical protein
MPHLRLMRRLSVPDQPAPVNPATAGSIKRKITEQEGSGQKERLYLK